MKIRPKLTLAFLLASLVPLVVLGVFSYNNSKDTVTSEALDQLQSVSVIQKHRVRSILSQNQERLALVSSRTQLRISLDNYLREGDVAEQERMNTILNDARASITDFEAINVLDLDGEVVASTAEAAIGSSLADEEAFIRGRAEESSGALLFLDEAGELKVYISGPLYLEGELTGVVVIRSNADNILSVVTDYAGLGSTGETLLTQMNEAGDALFITPLRFDPQAELRRTVSISKLDSPTVQALLKNAGLFDGAIDYRGEPVLAATQYIEEAGWGLVTKIDVSEALNPVAYLHRLTVLTIVLAAVIVIMVSLYLAQSIGKPVQDLALVVDKIRGGDVSRRAEVTSRDEIGMLARSFNEMTGKLVGTNKELRSVNRSLVTLSECNQILVHATEESALLRDVSQALITYGGYCWVWVGFVDPGEPETLRTVAEVWCNDKDSKAESVRSGVEKDHTLAMTAVRTGEVQVLRSISDEVCCAALRAEADERGYAALIALPLVSNGLTFGVLNIYAPEAENFNEDEVRLLTELSGDLAYGVTALRARVGREQAEAKYSTLVERSNDGIIIIQDGMLRFVNTRMVEVTGFSQEEALGRSFIEFVAPEYREMVAERYRRRLSGEEMPGSYEAEILTKSGGKVFVGISASLIEYQGKPADMAILRDITERKKAEETLRESEERYRALVDLGAEVGEAVVMLQDSEQSSAVHVFFNQEWPRITGYSGEELLGMSFFDLVHPEEREASQKRNQRKMRGEAVPGLYEIRIIRKDGAQVPVEVTSAYTKYLGKPANVAYIRDITERKKAEAALRHSELEKATILGSMSELMVYQDMQHKILWANKAAVASAGLAHEKLVGRHCYEIWPRLSEPCPGCPVVRARESGQPEEAEITTPDGRVWFIRGYPIRNEDGNIAGVVEITSDITRRKQAEAALRESEERYRSLVNNVKLGILRSTLGPPGKILAVNPALEEITGYSREELLKMDMVGLYAHAEDRKAFMKETASVKGAVTRELRWRKRDGSEITVLDRLIAVRGSRGEILYLDAIIEDITERKEAEAALRKSQAGLAEAQHMAHVGSWEFDLVANEVIWSDEVYAILGVKPKKSKLTFDDLLKRVHPDDMEMVSRVYSESVKNKAPYKLVHRVLLKDGTVKYVEERAETLYDDNGRPVRSTGTVQDVTEIKRAEEALAESEEKLRLIFESVADGITETNLEGVIVRVNEAVVRLHGYDSKEELIGKSALEIIAETDRARAVEGLKETLEKGYSGTLEYTFLKKDGTEFPAELSATLMVDTAGNPTGLVAVTKDITERNKMQEKLILTDRLASIGELASGVAHELNNPLTAVTGFSELALERDLPDDIREDIQTVYSEAQRAARVVKNLLTFARKHPSVRQPMSVTSAIEKVLDLRAYEQKVNNIQVVREFAPDLPEVKGDFFQIQQGFLNIIINAEHFMIEEHKGGTLTITAKRVGDWVQASFADDGPGIKKEHLKHIFDPFFTTKEVGRGTGLGLSICHGIVTEHGGRIYAESEYGHGATFVVELPMAVEGEMIDEEC